MSFCDNRFSDIGGHVGFSSAGHQKLGHPGVHAVDRGAGLAESVDLGGVLDHSQPPQHVSGQDRDHTEHVGEGQQVQRGHGICDGGRGGRSAERVGHQSVRVVAVYPVPYGQTEFGDRGFLQRRQFQPWHDHRRLAGGRQHQRGQPFERLRPRADQVAQVIARRDDEARQACICRGGRGGTKSLRIHVGAESTGGHGMKANRGLNSWRPRSDCRRGRGSSATSSGPARRSWRPGQR